MQIAFILKSVSKISETFIINQIIGMKNLGHDVQIFALRNSDIKKVHPDLIKYKLIEKTICLNPPQKKIVRILKAVSIISNNLFKHPKALKYSLNIFKHKKDALSLKLLFIVSPFFGKKFDIIHCFYGPTGLLGIKLKDIGLEGKLVTSFHGFDISKYLYKKNNIYNELFKKGDLFLPVCDYFKEKLIGLGCNKNKIIVHRTGINPYKIDNLKIKKINNGKIKLLSVGRLTEKKGIFYGIKAVSKVLKEYDIQYKIAGDGPLRESLEKLIDGLDLKKNIEILGFINNLDVLKMIKSSDILIAPSITSKNGDIEGIPNVLKEAMAAGVPVISTYHSGIPELVIDGYNGLLAPEKDIKALAEKIIYLIKNPDIRIRMGANGRKFVKKYYDIKELTLELEQIYKRVLI